MYNLAIIVDNMDVELPKGFPVTEKEARSRAFQAAVTEDFAEECWNLAMMRGGRDWRDNPIRSFVYYLKACDKYQRERIALKTAKNGAGTRLEASPSVWEITKVIEAKTELAKRLKNRWSAEVADGVTWSDQTKREEYVKLRFEIRELQKKVSESASNKLTN